MSSFFCIFIMSLLMMIPSCRNVDKDVRTVLSEVASIMESDHEQASTILDSIDQTHLGQRNLAKYSMLKSMALDKSYIDLTNDSIIRPAVKYYSHRGKADDKLKTLFYYARIIENAGEKDDALGIILKGEKYAQKAKDHLFVSRYYLKKSELYGYRFEWDMALQASLEAVTHSEKANDYRGLASALLTACSNYQILHQSDSVLACLQKVKSIWENINDYRKGQYYRLFLIYALNNDPSIADSVYSESVSSGISVSNHPYHVYADYFIFKADSQKAEENINLALYYGLVTPDSKEYENRRFKIDALNGNYQKAFESMSRYYYWLEEHEYEILTSDAKVLEERIAFERREMMSKFWVLLITGLSLMAIMLLATFCFHIMKQKRALNSALSIAKEEKQRLEEIRERGVIMNKEMQDTISKRIDFLNVLVLKKMKGKTLLSSEIKQEMEAMSRDRDGFMLSIAMQFFINYPGFMAYLKDHGLTDWETGFCCLYLLGLSGKEISAYVLSSSNAYNVSSKIRQKLGLTSHDSKLSYYLQSLLAEKSSH